MDQPNGRPSSRLKRRIPILKRLIADCDRLAADLDQEVRNEEDRVKIHDPAHSAYSTYARATTLRRDNLRRSADELRPHLAKAQKALIELGIRAASEAAGGDRRVMRSASCSVFRPWFRDLLRRQQA